MDVERALRKLKRSDRVKDLRKYEAYQKPSEKRRRAKKAAIMRERERVNDE